jgi:hypothetical protein
MILDAFGVDRFKTVASHDFKSRAERRICRLPARMAADGHDGHCVIQNISEGGLGLCTDSIVRLRNGQRLILSCKELGDLACTVRWCAHPRYGAEFDTIGKTSQAVRDFYDSLPASGG